MMGKKLQVCMLFLITLLFNIVGVNAQGVSNVDELNECLKNESICILNADINNSSESVEITITKDVALDLNGKSITNYNFVINDGAFTLNDSQNGGSITTTSKYAIYVSEATIIINGGKLESNYSSIYFDKSIATINSGEFIGKYYGASIYRASNVVINDGIFKGIEEGQYYGGYGISGSSSTLIINNGDFFGRNYGFKSSGGGYLEINNGNFEGEDGGVWLSNSTTSLNTKNYSLISGGYFKGRVAGRISGRNTNVITGGIFDGVQIGLDIECANPIQESCKESILLKGGTYKSSGQQNLTYASSAIFMNSDPENPIKITDIIESNYKLSDESLLEKDGGNLGYYSYTKSLNVSIENPNLNNSENNEESVVENPKTGINLGYGILILIVIVSSIIYILIRKQSKFLKNN